MIWGDDDWHEQLKEAVSETLFMVPDLVSDRLRQQTEVLALEGMVGVAKTKQLLALLREYRQAVDGLDSIEGRKVRRMLDNLIVTFFNVRVEGEERADG